MTSKKKGKKGEDSGLPLAGLHGWRNFPPNDKLAGELWEKVIQFEDATIKLRQALARKYNVVYHRIYFTREIPSSQS